MANGNFQPDSLFEWLNEKFEQHNGFGPRHRHLFKKLGICGPFDLMNFGRANLAREQGVGERMMRAVDQWFKNVDDNQTLFSYWVGGETLSK